MSDESKTNEEKNGTTTNENTEDTAKKEGRFSGFFKKVSQKLDDATYDSRLSSDFNKNNVKYQVFTGTGVFAANPEIAVVEHFDGERKYVTMLGEDDVIKAGCLIRKNNDRTVRHITEVEATTLTIEFEGKTNQKPALNIYIGDQAEKVNVIKVGDEFYKV